MKNKTQYFVRRVMLSLAVSSIALLSQAATFTVSNTNNAGAGSLRQAVLDANANGMTLDYINFNIPGVGPHSIVLSSLIYLQYPVVIDGYTQPGAFPASATGPARIKIIIDGNGSVGPWGISIDGGCTLKGLSIVNFGNDALAIWASNGPNVISGNYIGLLPDGVTASPNKGSGIAFAVNTTIGGPSIADRNVISSNLQFGVLTGFSTSTYVTIQNNFIGTDHSGTLARGNGWSGIDNGNSRNTRILDNIIAANNSNGIEVDGQPNSPNNPFGIIIQRNRIGVGLNGEDLGNNYSGVMLGWAYNNTIGGSLADANIIAYNNTGVRVSSTTPSDSYGNLIQSNSIYANSNLGIEFYYGFGGGGIVLNDPGDPDQGPNMMQNYPVITSAMISGNTLTVAGTFNSTPSASFLLEFFNNPASVPGAANPSNYGEGHTLIHSITVTTDGSGNANFNFSIAAGSVVYNDYLASIATNIASNNTSTFSVSAKVVAPSGVIDCVHKTAGYLITPLADASGYSWTVPASANITSGQGSNSITVDWGATLPGNHEVCVTAENICGNSYATCFPVEVFACDFGDVPASSGYPVFLADSGAMHRVNGIIWIGSLSPDGETDAQTHANAFGDTPDEDGVLLPAQFVPGTMHAVEIETNGAGAYLNAWIDWNADGDWDDAGEAVATAIQDGTPGDADGILNGVIALHLNVPFYPQSTPGFTFARFRLSSMPALSYSGFAPDGEVEDYRVIIGDQADIMIVKTALNSPAQTGAFLTYSLITTNAGPSVSHNIIVTDAVTAFPNPQYSFSLTGPWSSWPGSLNIGTLDPLMVNTLYIRGTVPAIQCSPVSNSATVNHALPDPNLANNASSIVTSVNDVIPPAAICQNIAVNLGPGGTVSLSPSMVNNGSVDNCGVTGIGWGKSVYNCSDLGFNTTTLYVFDATGNIGTCTAVIHVSDIIAPIVICKNIQIALDATGHASISAAMINNGSSDNCSIAGMSLSRTDFTCADVGVNNVVLTVVDGSGNSATCASTVTVTNPFPPLVSVNDVTVSEGDGNAVFTVSLDKPWPCDVIVQLNTSNLSAQSPGDYIGVTGHFITIPAGSTIYSLSIPVIDDNIVEISESFHVNLISVSGGGVADAQGLGTITDNDVSSISISNASAHEGNYLVFDVSLSLPLSEPVSFVPSMTDISAIHNIDFMGSMEYSHDGGLSWSAWVSGNISMPAMLQTMKLRIMSVDDTEPDNHETFSVQLHVSSANTSNALTSGTGTILDADLEIRGIVVEDVNALIDNQISGIGTNASGSVYANLLEVAGNTVIASVAVDNAGLFSFNSNWYVIHSGMAYIVALSNSQMAIGSLFTIASINTPWQFAGESIGVGHDGNADGKLQFTNGSALVSGLVLGIYRVPDLTPVITIMPNVMHGVTNYLMRVKVTEMNMVESNGLITIRIPKDNRWVMNSNSGFNQNMTNLGGLAVQNPQWGYSNDSTAHVFTTNACIQAGGSVSFGFYVTWSAGATKGLYTVASQLEAGSGGEMNCNNNVDAEKLDYFHD
jgi:hypothetical protein